MAQTNKGTLFAVAENGVAMSRSGTDNVKQSVE